MGTMLEKLASHRDSKRRLRRAIADDRKVDTQGNSDYSIITGLGLVCLPLTLATGEGVAALGGLTDLGIMLGAIPAGVHAVLLLHVDRFVYLERLKRGWIRPANLGELQAESIREERTS